MTIYATVTATAPNYWANYLINGDGHGLSPEDVAAADAWVRRQGMGMPVSCRDAGYLRFHDAGIEAPGMAQCEEYVFHDTRPRLPFIIRRRYFDDMKTWELFASFPTIAADSANWYNWQAEAENGDSFSCSLEYWNASKSVKGLPPARVAAFEKRIRETWENDPAFTCLLIRYERKGAFMDAARKASWQEMRAAK